MSTGTKKPTTKDETKKAPIIAKSVVKIVDGKLTMESLLSNKVDIDPVISMDSLISTKVISIGRNKVLVDINGLSTGIITGKELKDSADTFSTLEVGKDIEAVVVEVENSAGHVVLSLRKAAQEKAWEYFAAACKAKETVKVTVCEVNKGGLLFERDGVKGFIPVSQLLPEHYPRVGSVDADKIIEKLSTLIGKDLEAMVINISRDTGKLILSEKKSKKEEIDKFRESLEIGQIYKGKVSGYANFGIFVTFGGVEGLVHKSEISWGKVDNPADYYKEGDDIEVMLIGFKDGRLSLSVKRLVSDPWLEKAKKYKVGDKVKGKVTRIEKYGYFLRFDEKLEGLVHISEISWGMVKNVDDFAKVGGDVEAEIILLGLIDHQIGLSVKKLMPKPETKEPVAAPKADSKKATTPETA